MKAVNIDNSALVRPLRSRVRIGRIDVDALAFHQALDAVEELVARGRGGTVFTPNVDHVVQANDDLLLREAYARADLCLVDGMPVLWAARALGSPLPEKISGSDFVRPLVARAAMLGWRIYFLGARPGVGAKAKQVLEREFHQVQIVGVSSPDIDLSGEVPRGEIDAIRAAQPNLLFLALGMPKQEIAAERIREAVAPAVILGVGAVLDLVSGNAKRAPRWMSVAGLEWLYRLAREPRRLWRRYLLRDPRFLAIVVHQALTMAHVGASAIARNDRGAD